MFDQTTPYHSILLCYKLEVVGKQSEKANSCNIV